jgi:hypothetical protein
MTLELLQSAHGSLFIRSIKARRVFQPLLLFGSRNHNIKVSFISEHRKGFGGYY